MKISENFYIYSKQPRFYVPMEIIKLFKPRSPYFNLLKKKIFYEFNCKKNYLIFTVKKFNFTHTKEILKTFKMRRAVFKDRITYETYINKDCLFQKSNKAEFFFKLRAVQISKLLLIQELFYLFIQFFPRILFRVASTNWLENNTTIFIFKIFYINLFKTSKILSHEFVD
jgi:hypothetical protein